MSILQYIQAENFGQFGESIKLIENINVSTRQIYICVNVGDLFKILSFCQEFITKLTVENTKLEEENQELQIRNEKYQTIINVSVNITGSYLLSAGKPTKKHREQG